MRGGCGSNPIPTSGDWLVEPIDRLPISHGNQVPVKINRDRDGGMPHLLLHIDRALALLEQQTGEGMTQIMEANLSKP